MGGSQTKYKTSSCEKGIEGLKKRVRLLQEEINEIMCTRENEHQAYEREMMAFAFKKAEWKRERKKLKEEVKMLRSMLAEREESIRGIEAGMVGARSEKEWQLVGTSYLVERMREERARRDEAVEKWKTLYLAIKIELDDLIQETCRGERLCWRAEEEDLMDELKRELKAREETIELLQARVASMEQEESKREREVDILRQSLRIMSHKKKEAHTAKAQGSSKKLALVK